MSQNVYSGVVYRRNVYGFMRNRDVNKLLSYLPHGSPYSITERRVPELIPVLGSQSAGDVS